MCPTQRILTSVNQVVLCESKGVQRMCIKPLCEPLFFTAKALIGCQLLNLLNTASDLSASWTHGRTRVATAMTVFLMENGSYSCTRHAACPNTVFTCPGQMLMSSTKALLVPRDIGVTGECKVIYNIYIHKSITISLTCTNSNVKYSYINIYSYHIILLSVILLNV